MSTPTDPLAFELSAADRVTITANAAKAAAVGAVFVEWANVGGMS